MEYNLDIILSRLAEAFGWGSKQIAEFVLFAESHGYVVYNQANKKILKSDLITVDDRPILKVLHEFQKAQKLVVSGKEENQKEQKAQ